MIATSSALGPPGGRRADIDRRGAAARALLLLLGLLAACHPEVLEVLGLGAVGIWNETVATLGQHSGPDEIRRPAGRGLRRAVRAQRTGRLFIGCAGALSARNSTLGARPRLWPTVGAFLNAMIKLPRRRLSAGCIQCGQGRGGAKWPGGGELASLFAENFRGACAARVLCGKLTKWCQLDVMPQSRPQAAPARTDRGSSWMFLRLAARRVSHLRSWQSVAVLVGQPTRPAASSSSGARSSLLPAFIDVCPLRKGALCENPFGQIN